MISHEDLILITGAAGFIGSGVVRYLNDRGFFQIYLVDDIGVSEKWKNLQGKRFRDIVPIDHLFSWLPGKNFAACIHLGACADTLESNGDFLLQNNYRYTVRLAEWALMHGVRFIYASSAATYGDGSLGFSDDVASLRNLRPLNMYGYSKHLFDLWALEHGVLDRCVGLKYFNVFGPNEQHKGRMASMVCKMFPQAKKNGVIRLFKSTVPDRFAHGNQCRDFIYVKDAVRITCSFLNNSLTGIFNVGLGEALTWNRVARALFRALDLSEHIEYIDMPEELATQYQNYTCADMRKLSDALGHSGALLPMEYTLEEAVADYVKQYLVPGAKW